MKRSGKLSESKSYKCSVAWDRFIDDAKTGHPLLDFKASCVGRYYQEPLLRQMGDVDFLVRRKDLEKVGKFLGNPRGFPA